MGDPPVPTRSRSVGSPTPYVPDPEARARLAFADGPADAGAAAGSRSRSDRATLGAAAVAVAVVLIGALVLVGIAGRTDPPATASASGSVDHGPFDAADPFVAALPLPSTFTRLAPQDADELATAEFAVDGDFDAACAALGQALREMDPTFPTLTPVEYVGGGVNRCEAVGPMAALHGARVRALVLKVGTAAQLYIDDPVPPTSSP